MTYGTQLKYTVQCLSFQPASVLFYKERKLHVCIDLCVSDVIENAGLEVAGERTVELICTLWVLFSTSR